MTDGPSLRSPDRVGAADDRHPDPAVWLRGDVDPLEVLRTCGRTFHAASRVLPRGVRRDLSVLYAFCRIVDDCGDRAPVEGRDAGPAHELLDEVERCLDGRADTSPIIHRFRDLARARAIPALLPRQLIAGVRSDLSPVRVASPGELVRYAYSVASTVGLMMCRVLGVPRAGDPFAIDLGIAMQLTNIARDVVEDAGRDRVYLPASWIGPQVVLDAAAGDAAATRRAAAAVEGTLALADRYYASAAEGMRFLPLAVRPGIRAAAANYRAIGTVIRRDPVAAVHARAATGATGKAFRTAGAAVRALLDAPPMLARPDHDRRLHAPLAAAAVPVTVG